MLLAYDVTWNGGSLTITGSNQNDFILIEVQDTNGIDYVVVKDGLNSVYWNGSDANKNCTPGAVTEISVHGDGGADTINLFAVTESAGFTGTLNGNIYLQGGSGDPLQVGDNDTIRGSDFDDEIDGFAGDDNLLSYAGKDTIRGGPGNDTIEGEAGYYYGDEGNDIITVRFHPRREVYGGAGNDTITVHEESNNSHILQGDDGDDTIKGSLGGEVIWGGAGNDSIEGSVGDDTIYGGPGNDNIDGQSNNDHIYGGGGSDTLLGGFGNDTIETQSDGNSLVRVDSGENNDTITGGLGTDQIIAGEGDDLIYAGPGLHSIRGDNGNDTINGSSDTGGVLYGGGDNDTIYGGAKGDIIDGMGGDDEIWGYGGKDTIEGSSGDDLIYGGDENDTLFGDSATNSLDIGSDTVIGGPGTDTIGGGPGDDYLWQESANQNSSTALLNGNGGHNWRDGESDEQAPANKHPHVDTLSFDAASKTLTVTGVGDIDSFVVRVDYYFDGRNPNDGKMNFTLDWLIGSADSNPWTFVTDDPDLDRPGKYRLWAVPVDESHLKGKPAKVDVVVPLKAKEGEQASLHLYPDAGTAWVIDWGDGSPLQNDSPGDVSHVYTDDLASTINLTVDGLPFSDFPVIVENVAPVVSDLAVTPGIEGSAVTLSASVTDPGVADTFTVEIDWGDGTVQAYNYPAAGVAAFVVSESHVYADNGSYAVTMTVLDDDGGMGEAEGTAEVANASPALTSLAASASDEGGTATLAGAFNDPGSQDTFTLQVDWGDSTSDTYSFAAGTSSFSVTHSYVDDDPTGTASDSYPVTVTVTDDDEGSDSDSVSAQVNNVVPSLSSLAIAQGSEGISAVLSGLVSDQGTSDALTLAVNWGDGTAIEEHGYSGAASFSLTHEYADDTDNGIPYSVTVTLSDDDTGSVTDTVTILIYVNDYPTANPLLVTTDEDTAASITLTGDDGDPGVTQTLTFTIASLPGYGTLTGFDPVTGVVTGPLTYTPNPDFNGSDSLSITVTDDNTAGGSAATSEPATVTITVNPVNDAPDAINDGNAAILPGQVAVYDVLANDIDIDGDLLTITSVTQGSYGTVVINANGTVTYTASATFPMGATDTFTYTISDGQGGTDTASKEVNYSGSTLRAAEPRSRLLPSAGPGIFAGDNGFELTLEALDGILSAGLARWAEAGADTSVLDAAEFRIADLPGDILGAVLGGVVLVDRDAAGFGWFVDASPENDREFRRRVAETELWAMPASRAYGRMDLLTVVMHEMGHLLGIEHADDGSHGLMEDTLAAGVRRLPDDAAVSLLGLGQANGEAAARRRAALADRVFSDLAL